MEGDTPQNAFSTRLAKFGFNYYEMFVVDLLHEFELGVWKAIFTHLLRILIAAGGDRIQELNKRSVLFSHPCLQPPTYIPGIDKWPPLDGTLSGHGGQTCRG